VYLPQPFDETRVDVLHALMRAHPLATLVTWNESALVADHVPVQTSSSPAPHGMLRGHIARANPLWRQPGLEREALAIFQGPQVYISPSLYPTKQATGEVVPTWDYAVVHAYGVLRFVHDADWLLALVESLTDAHESSRRLPWKVTDAPADYVRTMLGAIVGFEFSITRLTGKWKVSQNRNAADRQGVIEGLRAAGDAPSAQIADMLSVRG
jgi:transcriptional regulator